MSKYASIGRDAATPWPLGTGQQAPHPKISLLLKRGLSRQANRLARFISLRDSSLPSAKLLAGRLAPALGAARLGDALILRGVRREPGSPEAQYHAARVILARCGHIVAWLRIHAWGDELGPGAPRHLEARWLALRATVAGRFRDFDSAESLLRAADELTPGLPEVLVARAEVLIQRDRRAAALAAVREALRSQSCPVEGVLIAADVLISLGRGNVACDVLLDAAVDTEDSRVLAQLAAHLAEQRRFRECLEWLERYRAASPLLDREGERFAAALRSRALDQVGELRSRPPQGVAAVRSEPGRVLLPVPFVQQDRYSCSPATLTELAAFWRRPVDHAAVAEAICYQGTPRHRARGWAERAGWSVREFRVTWESARAVLDRGVPFALVTRWGMAGHDQAVVGYDERRQSLLIRCPSRPFLVEVWAPGLLASQAWCGPRGTALLPDSERARLEGLTLLDAEAYDDIHAIEAALAEHRRDDAAARAARLSRREPASRLNLWASLLLARYDSDHATIARCVEALLAVFPGAPALELWRLETLRCFASPAVYTRMLTASCRRYPRDVALQSRLAFQLSLDPGQAQRAWSSLRPMLRRGDWSTVALNLVTLANIRGRVAPEQAHELIRLAAHVDDLDEWAAAAYFESAHARGRTSEGLAFLRARYAAYGPQSGDPAQTLVAALRETGDPGQAESVLDDALSLRPDDDELQLFAARVCAACGSLDRAASLLAGARGQTHRAEWLRAAATVARCRGDEKGALDLWRELLSVEPTAVDAHKAVAELLTTLGQPSVAEDHLRSARKRFPAHHALARLGLEAAG